MKTIVCQEPGKMELVETEAPAHPADDEVILQVKRIGICGTDIHAYNGNQPFFTYPRILGHELSGEVSEVGRAVSTVKKGDKVSVVPYMHCGNCVACRSGKTNCCTKMSVLGVHLDGGMREWIKVPASHAIPVHDLTWEEAAIVEPLSIGAHAVRRAAIQPGETVLVIGAGPIGLGVARFAKLQGANVIAMDMSIERLQFCQQWAESDHTVLASNQPAERILQVNNGEYPTIVFDATGHKGSMMYAFDLVSHGGKLVFVGLVKDQISFSDPDFHAKELTLMGSRNATIEDFQYVIRNMEQGKIDTVRFISETVPFAAAAERFGEIQGNRQLIKAVLSLD
ncbi:zinc-binding alcohol dehydrogenase family protein [Brevibacillus humidisoli]|uniref:zinc-binding alcohol dehydrogenase family protein n=1 Tax=Brevibacillus humidisoli TaxID=2895522 RepID=UPI001E29BEFB|nr:zinc-binding alcohol dehydrogenase family protein [Brevibacillus humidisoli]UFJ40291.1 zinc-binding alcohol dehydrogenase family protein [Brevibacillus humidisoli]